jgi:S-adenosylmethionine:tRNA ribosyltransferase-isomerase
MENDYSLDAYHFSLPQELIAQEAPEQRGASRLMVLDRSGGELQTDLFASLAAYLPPSSLLVVNNARVAPCRLIGTRIGGGGAEFLLLSPPPLLEPQEEDGFRQCRVHGLLRPSGRLRPGDSIVFAPDCSATVREKEDFGRAVVILRWQGTLEHMLERCGQVPLPPYIRRPAAERDAERYQTVYAKKEKSGAAAAPTAGLHITEALRESLLQAGHQWAELTLYVGYGTFSPVRTQDIRRHTMHEEWVEINTTTVESIRRAKEKGRTVVAVGTTVVRALEGAYAAGGRLEAYSGPTNIFLYPGLPVRVVDQLITNFHLPGSSLLMLVSAFAGRETILKAYKEAATRGFRFFSYGDAMLIR